MQQLQKRHSVHMLKANKNGCKNAKQTNLLVQGARTAVQKSQITVDTKHSQQTTKYVSYL